MSALTKIKSAGFAVFLYGDSFKITPSSSLSIQQREFLKSHRAEIISELQNKVEWRELPDPKPNALMVTCFTPNGKIIEVEAKDETHADFLRNWNPRHQPN